MTLIKRQGAGRPKSEEKKQQIMQAASTLFLECGFAATSMDLVANRAGVSKQTVYSHFANKDALYVAVIGDKCAEYCFDEENVSLNEDSLEESLTQLGTQFVKLITDPIVIATYKTLIGGTNTNQHVTELFYSTGTVRGLKLLVDFLTKQEKHPVKESKAKPLAAMFFNTLKGEYHMKGLLGLPYDLSEEQLQKHVENTVSWLILCLRHESQNQE